MKVSLENGATSRHFINGEKRDHLSIEDRGLTYGDGLFETIWVHTGVPFYLEAHLARLHLGCERLNFPSWSIDSLLAEITTLCQKDHGILKIILTRGRGPRGYGYSGITDCTRIVSFFPQSSPHIPVLPQAITAKICQFQWSQQPRLAGIKHLNRLENILASSELYDAQEGVVLNTAGKVISGTMTNLFFIKNDIVYTPEIKDSGVSGIARAQIIQYCHLHHIPCYEVSVTLNQLLDASEIFFCNSLKGIMTVKHMVGYDKSWHDNFTAHFLKSSLGFVDISLDGAITP